MDVAVFGADRTRLPRRIRVHVDLEHRCVAHDGDRVTELLEAWCDRAWVEAFAGDDAARAVVEAGVVVAFGERRRRGLVRKGRSTPVLAHEPHDKAGEDDDEPVRSRVHDTGLAIGGKLIARPLERLLTRRDGRDHELGQHSVLLGVGDARGELLGTLLLHRGGHRGVHVADHAQHRPLLRIADRLPGGL